MGAGGMLMRWGRLRRERERREANFRHLVHRLYGPNLEFIPEPSYGNQWDKENGNKPRKGVIGTLKHTETGEEKLLEVDCEVVLKHHKRYLKEKGEEYSRTKKYERVYARYCAPFELASPSHPAASSRPVAAGAASRGIHTKIRELAYTTVCGPIAASLASLQKKGEEGIHAKIWDLAYTAFCGPIERSTPPTTTPPSSIGGLQEDQFPPPQSTGGLQGDRVGRAHLNVMPGRRQMFLHPPPCSFLGRVFIG